MKIGVVGSGMVGGAAAFAAVMTGAASEIVLVDVNEKVAQAQAEDFLHAVPYAYSARVSSGDFEELEGAGVVLICCGVAQRPGGTRLQLLKRNAAIYAEVVPKVVTAAPEAVLVAASNPVDLITSRQGLRVAGRSRSWFRHESAQRAFARAGRGARWSSGKLGTRERSLVSTATLRS